MSLIWRYWLGLLLAANFPTTFEHLNYVGSRHQPVNIDYGISSDGLYSSEITLGLQSSELLVNNGSVTAQTLRWPWSSEFLALRRRVAAAVQDIFMASNFTLYADRSTSKLMKADIENGTYKLKVVTSSVKTDREPSVESVQEHLAESTRSLANSGHFRQLFGSAMPQVTVVLVEIIQWPLSAWISTPIGIGILSSIGVMIAIGFGFSIYYCYIVYKRGDDAFDKERSYHPPEHYYSHYGIPPPNSEEWDPSPPPLTPPEPPAYKLW